MRRIFLRVAVILGPLIVLILYLAFTSQGEKALPNWAPWTMVGYFCVVIFASALLSRYRSGAPASLTGGRVLGDRTRTVLKLMLLFYISSFLAGSFMLFWIRKALPLQYGVLALGFNLAFVLLLCGILYSKRR
jgi:nicotinamide riboside transporter PnuC